MEYNYFPILKTTDAELKGYEKLPLEVKKGILPIFELTRSRRTPLNQNRAIQRNIDRIKIQITKNPFILDLTTEAQLKNEEIDDILEGNEDGYKKWVDLVKQLKDDGLNIIPVIHYNPYCLDDVALEIQNLLTISSTLAFRVVLPEDSIIEYLTNIFQHIKQENLILILDREFLSLQDGISDKSGDFLPQLNEISTQFPNIKAIACAFSSFPDSVVRTGYGQQNEGSFARAEKITTGNLKNRTNMKNLYSSDYASIHPKRYYTSGAQWIPRIDFLDSDKMFYFREKREKGGYIEVAKKVIRCKNYFPIKSVNVWGDDEIAAAANGYPNGLSPSHWIAVRVNLYISTQYVELKGENRMTL